MKSLPKIKGRHRRVSRRAAGTLENNKDRLERWLRG